MRMTSVSFHTTDDDKNLEFSLKENPSSRYIVRSIVGIDAEELIPRFYAFGAETDAPYYEYTMKPRDIVMRVVLNPLYQLNETASELRDELYRLISYSRTGKVQLQFRDGATTVAAISGMITKFEALHFARVPEVQITVTCPDPIFRSVHPVDIPVAELPTTGTNVTIFDSISTAPHGFSFKVKFTATRSFFVIQDTFLTPDWQFVVDPPTDFQIDDELWFSNEYGAKQLFWNKASGTDVNLMDKVWATSVWPQIFPGKTSMEFTSNPYYDWLEFNYYGAHWGL